MQPFDIQRTGNLLIMTRRREPVIYEAVRTGIIVIAASLAAWFGIVDVGSGLSLYTFYLAVLTGFAYESYRIRQVFRGDIWRFERVGRCVLHNNSRQASIDNIESVRVWEDCGSDNIEHRIALVMWQGKPVIIGGEGNVPLDEMTVVAEEIAEFLNVPLVHERR